MHPGAAFSWLEENDELPVASEGDILGAVTQLVTKSLTGKLGCLLDMTSPDFDRDQILMWHGGGGPLFMAKDDLGKPKFNATVLPKATAPVDLIKLLLDLSFMFLLVHMLPCYH